MSRVFVTLMLVVVIAVSPALAKKKPLPKPVTIEVTDLSGAVVAGARIELLSAGTTFSKSAQSDHTGRASFELLPGGYDIEVTATGFRVAKRHIEVNSPLTLNVMLKVGGCPPDNCLAVEAEANNTVAPPIDTSIKPDAPVERSMPAMPLTIEITDTDGAVVSKALITLHSPETQCGETIVTDDNGRASTTVRLGHYELVVRSSGYADAKQAIEFGDAAQTVHVVVLPASYSGPDVTPTEGPPSLNLRMAVVDATGKSVPGARIRLRAQGFSSPREVRTDADGRASVDVPAEQYDLSVIAQGFKIYQQQGYLHAERELKITLDPGECASVFPNSTRKTQ